MEENQRSRKTSVVTKKGEEHGGASTVTWLCCGALDTLCSTRTANKMDPLTCAGPDSCRTCRTTQRLEDLVQSLCSSGKPAGREDICQIWAEAQVKVREGMQSGDSKGTEASSECWRDIARVTGGGKRWMWQVGRKWSAGETNEARNGRQDAHGTGSGAPDQMHGCVRT